MKEALFYKHHPDAQEPKRNNPEDAGADLISIEDVFIPLGTTAVVKTGIAVRILPGWVGIVSCRSSIGKAGLSVAGGVIDSGYTGSIDVILHNNTCKRDYDFFGNAGYKISKGDKIAQLVIYQCALPKFIETKSLWDSMRGMLGFGSSGR